MGMVAGCSGHRLQVRQRRRRRVQDGCIKYWWTFSIGTKTDPGGKCIIYTTTTLYHDYNSQYAAVTAHGTAVREWAAERIILYIIIAYTRTYIYIYISYTRTRPIIYIGPFRYSSGPYPTYIRRRCHVYNVYNTYNIRYK